jgi:hypothetical protein
MWRSLLILTVLGGCGGDEQDETDKPHSLCEQLREHVIDVKLAAASQIDLRAHHEAMRRALGNDFVTACKSKMSDAQVMCALNVSDSDALGKCVSGR